MARAVALNLLKALALVAVLAAAFGGLGWLIGGITTALLFAFCSLLAATAVYRYGDRALLGMLGARPFALAEDPVLRSGADKVAAKLGVRAPQLYLIDDGFPRLFAVGRGPSSSTLAISVGALQVAPPRGARGGDRARARARPPARRARADVRRPVRGDARRDEPARRLVLALSPLRLRADRRSVRPRHALAQAGAARRCARSDRRPGAAHDLADALMRLDRAAELVDFAASPATEPLYPIDPFEPDGLARMFKTHPPLDARVRRLRELGAGQNGRVSRVVTLEARRVAARTSRSRGCARPGGADAHAGRLRAGTRPSRRRAGTRRCRDR